MRIGLLLPSLRLGGTERLALTLAREFRAKNQTPIFILMVEEGELVDEARQIGQIYTLGTSRVRSVPGRLSVFLKQIRLDAIIANLWPLTVAAALGVRMVPRAWRPTLALVEHCNLSKQYADWSFMTRLSLRASLALTCRLANYRIAVSRGVALDIAKLSCMSVRKFDVIHNPVATAIPSRNELLRAEAVWGSRTGRRILAVGTLKKQKNHELLIRAFARMCKPGDKLLILGEGTLRPELTTVAQVNGVVDAVLLPGFDRNPSAFYATADLFVLSSDYEGFGNVIVEALAAGLPVVSTDCPSGPAEILDRRVLGALVPVGDAVAMAAAMTEKLASPGDPTERQARASDFEPEKVAATYVRRLSCACNRAAGADKNPS